MADASYGQIGHILREQAQDLLARWVETYRRSRVRMPHPVDPAVLSRLVAPILEGLADALGPSMASKSGGALPASALVPGSSLTREAEKAAALVGAILATEGTSGFDVSALFYALRDVLAAAPLAPDEARSLSRFTDWLNAVACDSFSSARVQAERERWREQLEDGTPVVLAAADVPLAFLIGRPDGVLLDSVLSRLLLLVVRVGARAAVIDVAGLADPARPEVLEALGRFLSHRKIARVLSVVVVGLDDEPSAAWRELAARSGTELSCESYFDRALERALSATGYRLVKT